MSEKVRYAARVNGVLELALGGTADLEWWRERLVAHGLEPCPSPPGDGVPVTLTGMDSKWKGIAFRELSITVGARRGDEDAPLLAGAFNTCRFFAFTERVWFKTPYVHCRDVDVALADGGHIRVGPPGALEVCAEMAAREPGSPRPDGYTGPLFLPTGSPASHRRMIVDIRGDTEIHPYDPARDRFELHPDSPILTALAQSSFTPRTWHVRRNATHARSKTLSR